MNKIAIIGGGFGGLYTAKNLLKNLPKNYEVVLINPHNYFLFTPLLHEVATGFLNRHNVVEPIREIIKHKQFRFIRGKASYIDIEKQKIHLENENYVINFDFLILALGSSVNTYSVKGAENAMPLKTIMDSISIRDKILCSLEKATVLKNKIEIEKALTFSIIGAGPTGVQIAGDISDLLKKALPNFGFSKNIKPKIYLVHALNKILPYIGDKSRQTAEKKLRENGVTILTDSLVTEIKKDEVIIKNQKKILSDTIIWAGGIKPNMIKSSSNLVNKNGFILIDNTLRSTKNKNIFALGDCSYIENNPLPALAQTAVEQSKTVAQNVLNTIKNKPLNQFNFNNKGYIVSLGARYAVGEIYISDKTLNIKGKFAWFLKRHIYLMNIIGIQNKIKVGIEWFLNLIFPIDTSEI